jgi:hypothetical protein
MGFDRNLLPAPVEFFEGEGHTLKGQGEWRSTSCPFHGGRSSMRVNVKRGSFVCMSCGAKGGDIVAWYMADRGVDFIQAALQLGAWNMQGGEPTLRTRPAPLPARDALQVLAFEANLAAVAAGNLAKGLALTQADRTRLRTAAQRIQRVREACT